MILEATINELEVTIIEQRSAISSRQCHTPVHDLVPFLATRHLRPRKLNAQTRKAGQDLGIGDFVNGLDESVTGVESDCGGGTGGGFTACYGL